MLFGVRQRGHAHEPISLMAAIKTLKNMNDPNINIKVKDGFTSRGNQPNT